MAHLDGMISKTKLNNFQKGQIVAYADCGLSGRQIGKKIGRAQSTVAKFLQDYNSSSNYERRIGSGRKRKTTNTDDQNILSVAIKTRTISAKQIKRDLNMNISPQTIRNRLHEAGYYSHFQVKKPFVSIINQQRRLTWAKEHLSWSTEEWKKLLWSDESPYVLRFQHSKRVWRLPNERYSKSCMTGTVKQDKRIMVWGCFASHGVGNLYRVKGIMDKEQYHQILIRQMVSSAKKLFKDGNFIFQHDNDPKHKAKIIQKYLERKNITTLDWPSQSPDLNPIENVWIFLDKQVADRNPQNENELFQVLEVGWINLPTDFLTNLVESTPRRCQAVIKNGGMPTKY